MFLCILDFMYLSEICRPSVRDDVFIWDWLNLLGVIIFSCTCFLSSPVTWWFFMTEGSSIVYKLHSLLVALLLTSRLVLYLAVRCSKVVNIAVSAIYWLLGKHPVVVWLRLLMALFSVLEEPASWLPQWLDWVSLPASSVQAPSCLHLCSMVCLSSSLSLLTSFWDQVSFYSLVLAM